MPTDFGRYESHQLYYMGNWDNEAKKIQLEPVTIGEDDNKAWHDEDDHIGSCSFSVNASGVTVSTQGASQGIKLEIPIEDAKFIEKLKEPDESVHSELERLRIAHENALKELTKNINMYMGVGLSVDEVRYSLQTGAYGEIQKAMIRKVEQDYKNKLKEEMKMEKCKFKVGDKVRIKKNCEKIEDFCCGFNSDMKKYEGEICEIEDIRRDGKGASVTGNYYTWDIRALEFVSNKTEVEDLDHYIINDGATILFWDDGTKTIVKRTKEDKFDKRVAFLTAYFQKTSGLSRTKANKFLANLKVEEPKEKTKKVTKVSKAENPIEEVNLEELVKEVKKKRKGE